MDVLPLFISNLRDSKVYKMNNENVKTYYSYLL